MPSSNLSDPNASRPDRGGPLHSWKEIAAYLNRSVVTVRRWEKKEALPVHRDKKTKSVAVRAYQSELDQWSRTRENEKQAEAGSAPRVPVEAESGPETILAEPPDPEQGAPRAAVEAAPAEQAEHPPPHAERQVSVETEPAPGEKPGEKEEPEQGAVFELEASGEIEPAAELDAPPEAEAEAGPETVLAEPPDPEQAAEAEPDAAAESPDPPRPATVSEVEEPPEPEPPEPELADEPVHEMEAADAEEAAVQAPAETEISVSGGVAQQPPAEPVVVPEAAAAPEAFVPAPGPPPSEDLLNSWKEIAAYFDCSVGTVRRWEKRKGLPVHRDERKSPVWIYAYRWELEQWDQAGAGASSSEAPGPLAPPPLPPLAPGRLETVPEQATAPPPLDLPTAEVELPPVDDTTRATVSVAKSSEADSAGEMPPLVLAQAGLTVFGGMLLVIYLIGMLVNGKVLAQVLSAGVLMIFPLAIAPIVIGSLIIRRSEKSGHRPPGFVWAQAGMYVGLTLAVITTLIVAFAAAVEMMQLIAALLIPQMPHFL